MPTREVAIEDIRIDGGTQIRERIDEDTVADYAEKLATGADFPACIIFHDGSDNWLADGFHRAMSHTRAGRDKILCDIRKGTKRDAIFYAIGANKHHGLRLGSGDKKRAVVLMLEQWGNFSQTEIAKHIGVSQSFVSQVAASYKDLLDRPATTTATRNGKTFEISTANIGRKPSPAPEPRPDNFDCTFCGELRPTDPGRCPWCKDEGKPGAITDDAEPLIEVVEVVESRPNPMTLVEPGGCTTDDLGTLITAGRKFACIYADPAWQYGNQATRASTDNHYPTMTVDDICALPVAELAADNAHLHLWTTNGFLFEAKRVMEAWGFEYKSVMVWVKPQMGIGNYWRVSHEFLLLGTRGKCPYLNRAQMSWHRADRTSHSTKPEDFREKIELVSPGPRLELFGRKTSPGWTVWGNQIARTMFDVAEAV